MSRLSVLAGIALAVAGISVGLLHWLAVPQAVAAVVSPSIVDITDYVARQALDRNQSTRTELVPLNSAASVAMQQVQPAPIPSAASRAMLRGPEATHIEMTVTVGTDFNCSFTGSTITVPAGSQLVYCYIWVNNTDQEYWEHDLVDSEFGTLFEDFIFPLPPQTVVAFYLPALAVTTTTNTAVWTAANPTIPLTQTAVASATVVVSGTLPQVPQLHIYPAVLESGQPTDTQTSRHLTFSNLGNAPLTWAQTECSPATASWFALQPISGTVPPRYGFGVTATFDSTGLSVGTYTSTLCLNTNDPAQLTVTVPITLEVFGGGGGLALDVTAGTNPHVCGPEDVITVAPGTQVFFCYTVTNSLPIVLDWHTIDSQIFGTIPDIPFPLGPGHAVSFLLQAPVFVTVTDVVTWTSSTWEGFSIAATDGVTVNVAGDPQPRAAVYPQAVAATLLPDFRVTRTLEIRNEGAADLNWALDGCQGSLPGWLQLAPVSGTLPYGASSSTAVSLDSSGLLTGTYATDLCLNSNDPVQPVITVPVTLDVVTPGIGSLIFTKTVGTDPNICAGTAAITVTSGAEVSYCYQIFNDGNTLFLFHDVVDSVYGTLAQDLPFPVLPGEQIAFVLPGVPVTETTASKTIWTVEDDLGQIFVAAGTTTVTVPVTGTAAINLDVTVGLDGGCATTKEVTAAIPAEGLPVTYCYRVTNEGDHTLTRHDVADSLHGPLMDGMVHDLPVGMTFVMTQSVTIFDTTANSVTWRAYTDAGPDAWDTDTAMVYAETAVAPVYSIYLPMVQSP